MNSAGIRANFSTEFTRCKDNTNPKCDFGSETCSVEFTPTIPGVYQAEFYNIVKYKEVDEVIRPIPFTAGQFARTVIVMPGPTSAGHSHAHGPGLDFAFASRSGLGSYFWIDSYDRFENPRLTGLWPANPRTQARHPKKNHSHSHTHDDCEPSTAHDWSRRIRTLKTLLLNGRG